MGKYNVMEAEDVNPFSIKNQEITGEVSKSLLCSSTASNLDQGSIGRATSLMGIGKECFGTTWYYMFLRNREMKRYIDIFTGQTAVKVKTKDDKEEECHYNFKVFPYTSANHRKRSEKCNYSKETYENRKEAVRVVKEVFSSSDTHKLNSIIDKDQIHGDGFLFVCAQRKDLNVILANTLPIQHLVTNYHTSDPAQIPNHEMQEFIYHYESMPYNIELLHPLEDYVKTKQKIRITGGIFIGKEGYLMRLHRNSHLVFTFGNMTVAISGLHAFPFEKIN